MCAITMSKSNTANRNITATNANIFVFPTLNILYVCLCTVTDTLSYLPVKDTPCTKLDVTVNCSCLLVWAILDTQVPDKGKKYCLSLLVQEILSQRSETWNDNINIQLHNRSLSNAKLCDVWNSGAYVKKHRARRSKCALEFSPQLFMRQNRINSSSCSLESPLKILKGKFKQLPSLAMISTENLSIDTSALSTLQPWGRD